MKNALIGYTGFVGQNLNKDRFNEFINSKNIKNFKDHKFELLVIAAGDARKWYANQNPSVDLLHVLSLFEDIINIQAKKVVLLSTIDIYPDYREGCVSDENSTIYSDLPYGMHRLMLEKLIKFNYNDVSIIRLPGLMGKNLKKNIIYDICNARLDQLKNYNLDSFYQYFDLKELDGIIDMVLESKYELLNIASEPISVMQIVETLRLKKSNFSTTAKIVKYDVRTTHHKDGYFYNAETILTSIKKYFENY
jgi:nucleoside-diphosphate-sugar epimerase